jgi:hypothetical protein
MHCLKARLRLAALMFFETSIVGDTLMNYLRSALCVAVLLVAAPLVLCAQQAGVLTGTVVDQSGAVIQGASVVVSGNNLQSQTTTTNSLGTYKFSKLSPGSYTVVVSNTGFKESRSEYVNVTADETTPLDVTLNPAGVETVTEVQASGQTQVETETSQQSGTITEKEVVTFGLNGRNFSQLIALAAGVSNQTGQDEAKVGVAGSAKYSVNGGRVEYNAFDVDGSDVLNTGINASKGKSMPLIVYPSLDAIEEVKVLTSNYGAQYGRSASGSVLVTTKSGKSDFHGNAYEFLRNEFFNARNYFDETSKAPLYRKNDFGATFGGPLYIPNHYNTNKDKTFFFFSEEARFEKSPENGQFNQAVPSNKERAGDFSDVCPVIPSSSDDTKFDVSKFPDCPSIGTALSGGQLVGRTFNNNKLGINGVANTILNNTGPIGLLPQANSATGCTQSFPLDAAGSPSPACYVTTVSPSTTWREELFRIDHNFTPGEKLSFRYIHDAWTTTALSPEWGYLPSVNSFPSVQNQFNGPGLSMVLKLDQVFSPTLLNQLSVSYTDTHITLADEPGKGVDLTRPAALYPSACPGGQENSCLGYIFNNGFGGKLPGINIAGNNGAYGGQGFAIDTSYMPWDHRNPTGEIRDGLSKVIGKHTLQTGIAVIYSRESETNGATGANTGDQQGLLTFSNQANWESTGNAFADFLIGWQQSQPQYNGRVRYFQQDSTQRRYHLNYTVIEPYLQDDWRVTPRLTVNMGLRLSVFGNWQMKQGEAWNWEPSFFNRELASKTQIDPFTGEMLNASTGNPIPFDLDNLNPSITNGLVQCGTRGTPSSCMSSHLVNPAPRIGFAWDPTGSGKTSIRAGYGVFFEHGTSSESNVGSLIGNAPLVLDVTQDFPGPSYSGVGTTNTSAPSGAWPINVTSIPTKVVWPYTQQWSLSGQHQISKDTMVAVAYVGSKGTHLTVQEQVNQLPPVPSALNPFLPGQPITTQICSTFGTGFKVEGLNGPSLAPGNPAYLNLEAACVGDNLNGGTPDINTLRQTAPGLGSIYSVQNLASSVYHALQITVQHTQGPLNVGAAYTYGHSIDSASGRYSTTFVNEYDLAANRASSDFDQRHMLNLNYVYKLPLLNWYSNVRGAVTCSEQDVEINSACAQPGAVLSYDGPGGLMKALFSGWNLSGITSLQTGTPFSVINGESSNGVSVLDNAGLALGIGADSYPDKVNGFGCPTTDSRIRTIGPLLDSPCSFVAPRGLTQGNAGRNSINNPGRINFDTALFRQMKVLGERTLEFRAEAFNIFNHTQFRVFDPDKGNTDTNTISCYGGTNNSAGNSSCIAGNAFLHPVDARRSRTMQFGMKFGF